MIWFIYGIYEPKQMNKLTKWKPVYRCRPQATGSQGEENWGMSELGEGDYFSYEVNKS